MSFCENLFWSYKYQPETPYLVEDKIITKFVQKNALVWFWEKSTEAGWDFFKKKLLICENYFDVSNMK